MAKASKGPRQFYGMKCNECGSFNYITQRNKVNTPDKLKLSKYCNVCQKHTEHTESKKLK